MTPRLIDVLQALYRSEINASVSSFWDSDWNVQIGDEINGFKVSKGFRNEALDDAAAWLVAEAKSAYPDSDFAKSW